MKTKTLKIGNYMFLKSKRKSENTSQENKNHIRNSLNDFFSPLRAFVNDKWRLKERIRIANMWAKRNPKKFMATFLISMFLIFALDIIMNFAVSTNKNKNENQLLMVNNVFDGMRNIDRNHENIRDFFRMILTESQYLTHQLDSLNNIEIKSHQDSVLMVQTLNRINVIQNILSHEKN